MADQPESVLAGCAPAFLPFLATAERLSTATASTALLHVFRCQAQTLVIRPKALVEIEEEEKEEDAALPDETEPAVAAASAPAEQPQEEQPQQP